MSRKNVIHLAFDTGLYCWITAMLVTYGYGLGWDVPLGAIGCAVLMLRLALDTEFRKQAVLQPIDSAVLAVWLIEIIGLARSTYRSNTLQSFIGVSTLISVYYVIRLSIRSRGYHVGLWLLGAAVGLLLSFVTTINVVFEHLLAAFNHLGDAGNLKAVLTIPVLGGSSSEKLSILLAILPFPVLAVFSFWRKNRGVSVLSAASVLLLLVSVALTLSRGMYLAVGVFAVVLVSLLLRYSETPRRYIVFIVAILIVVVATIITPWRQAVVTTALMARTPIQLRSMQGRAEMWRLYLTIFQTHPAFGVGSGNLGLIPVHLEGRDPAEGYVPASAFNTAVMLLVEEGGVGLLCYLILLACFVLSILRWLRRGLDEFDLLEVSLCLAAIIGLCVRDLTACTILTQPMTALLVCILAAMATQHTKTCRVADKRDKDSSTAKLLSVISPCVGVIFVATLCLLTWKSFQLARAEARYEDCASALKYGNNNGAKTAIEDAVNLDGGNALYFGARGLVNAKPLDEAPLSWPIENNRRLSPGQQRSLELSTTDYESVVRLNSSDALAWHNLGWLYFFRGNRGRALEALERSASLEVTDWTPRVSLGLQLESSGRMTEAFAAYREALRLDPHLVDTRFFAELQQRHPDSAGAIVSQALAILQSSYAATHSPVLAAKAGKLALFKGDMELATSDLEYATRQLPTLYRAWMNLAAVYNLRGNSDKAMRCLDIAIQMNPLDAEIEKRRDAYYATQGIAKSKQYSFAKPHKLELQDLGEFSDRNLRLMREYLNDPEINNNIVPQRLLSYCDEVTD